MDSEETQPSDKRIRELEKELKNHLKNGPVIETYKLFENLPRRNGLENGPDQENQRHPSYRSCNHEYGLNCIRVPESEPTIYYPLSQKFSSEMARFGMYRNYSLNTQMDKKEY